MSADKDLMRGFPIQLTLTLVHTELLETLVGRMGVELGKEIKTVLSTGAQDLSLTCKGRTLPPSPPAISMFSICERVVNKCEPKPQCSRWVCSQHPGERVCHLSPHTHRHSGTTGGSPATWWHPSSCASVLEPPPHQVAQNRVYLEAEKDCLKNSQGKGYRTHLQGITSLRSPRQGNTSKVPPILIYLSGRV